MKRRLYFLLPDRRNAKKALDRLLLARIDDNHIHVMAKEGADLGDLPEADVWQKSDLIHGMEQGLFVGGLTGILAGGLLLFIAPEGLDVGYGAVLGLALLGAVFGSWVSGLIGFDVPNSQLTQFDSAIQDGQILMMVDVPKGRVDEVTELIRSHYPGAKVGGEEPTIPAFP
ncbi:MAG TPA: DUF1269 domain-containing protein [Acidiferrobacteraceae bacterium]|nr:DUF1269 domain-containing protein [Acidiferrobacteraceae bacterium]